MARRSVETELLLVDAAPGLSRQLARRVTGDPWRRARRVPAAEAHQRLLDGRDDVAIVAPEVVLRSAALGALDESRRARVIVAATRDDPRIAKLPDGCELLALPASRAAIRHAVRRALATAQLRASLAAAHQSLARQQELARLGDVVVDWRAQRVELSRSARRIFGLPARARALRFESLRRLVLPAERDAFSAWWSSIAAGEEARPSEHRILRSDRGERIIRLHAERRDDAGGPRLDAIVHDVTDRRRVEEELTYQVRHDVLTGLANRRQLLDHLERALHDERGDRGVAVLVVDLDRFKDVNESLGEAIGDKLLVEIAARLRSGVREEGGAPAGTRDGDLIARTGSDEFAIVIRGLRHGEDARRIAQRVAAAIARPVELCGRELFLTSCIGAALAAPGSLAPRDLVKHAEAAMHAAKEVGRGSVALFDPSMERLAERRIELSAALRRGLERGEIETWYQPRVDLARGRIVGVEALARWRHPQLGLVSPAEFIPLAEESGLIVELGERMLVTACAQGKAWLEAGLGELRIAVNVSGDQFRDRSLLARVDAALERSGLPRELLELELTESTVMHDVEAALETMRQVKARGIHLAIDDFGTGYSSLAYLKRFPIDCLKIDRSFVRDVTSDADSAAIASLIVMMAHRLHLIVVAEGVENEAQAEYLRRERCDQVQGFHFSRPLEPAEATALLEQQIVSPIGA